MRAAFDVLVIVVCALGSWWFYDRASNIQTIRDPPTDLIRLGLAAGSPQLSAAFGSTGRLAPRFPRSVAIAGVEVGPQGCTNPVISKLDVAFENGSYALLARALKSGLVFEVTGDPDITWVGPITVTAINTDSGVALYRASVTPRVTVVAKGQAEVLLASWPAREAAPLALRRQGRC